MSDDADAVMRDRIRQRLSAGLQTDWAQRAAESGTVSRVCQRLRALPVDDLDGKLIAAGFTLTPFVDPAGADGLEQSCANCMYFERHRQFCNLPGLMLPVEPSWSCILWRI